MAEKHLHFKTIVDGNSNLAGEENVTFFGKTPGQAFSQLCHVLSYPPACRFFFYFSWNARINSVTPENASILKGSLRNLHLNWKPTGQSFSSSTSPKTCQQKLRCQVQPAKSGSDNRSVHTSGSHPCPEYVQGRERERERERCEHKAKLLLLCWRTTAFEV